MPESLRFLLAVSCLAAYQPGQSVVSASPMPRNFEDWFKHSFIGPGRGSGSLKDEIECYSLPFGGLGFVSNVLTYYSIIMFGLGLSPWRPFAYPFLCCFKPCGMGKKPFKQWIKLQGECDEPILATVSFLISVSLALYTIYRCRIGWEFVLMAVWKATLSATLSFMGLHCWYIIRINKKKEENRKLAWTLLWVVLYALGTLIGSVGLISLVAKTFSRSRDVKIITGVFAGVLGIGSVLGSVLAVAATFYIVKSNLRDVRTTEATMGDSGGQNTIKARKWSVPVALGTLTATLFLGFEILVAFYGDFVLAAIAENWSGAPSSETKLIFWAYFAAKRLPLLFS